MNKLVTDLNKLFVKNSNLHIVHVYDLLRKLNTNEWKHYVQLPPEGYTKRNLIHKNNFDYELCLYSWNPGSVCREKFDNMSVYKVLHGRIYQFENTYEGTVGIKNNIKYIDYNNFDSLQTNMISHSLHIHLKN